MIGAKVEGLRASLPRPGFSVCTANYAGNNNGCPHPRVDGAESSLCARHLLIALADVRNITTPALVAIVKKEEHRA